MPSPVEKTRKRRVWRRTVRSAGTSAQRKMLRLCTRYSTCRYWGGSSMSMDWISLLRAISNLWMVLMAGWRPFSRIRSNDCETTGSGQTILPVSTAVSGSPVRAIAIEEVAVIEGFHQIRHEHGDGGDEHAIEKTFRIQQRHHHRAFFPQIVHEQRRLGGRQQQPDGATGNEGDGDGAEKAQPQDVKKQIAQPQPVHRLQQAVRQRGRQYHGEQPV